MDIFNQNWQQRIKNDELTRTYLTGDGKEYVKVKTAERIRNESGRNVPRYRIHVYDKQRWKQLNEIDDNNRIFWPVYENQPAMRRRRQYYNPNKIQEGKLENRSSYSRVNSLYNLHYASLR